MGDGGTVHPVKLFGQISTQREVASTEEAVVLEERRINNLSRGITTEVEGAASAIENVDITG